LLSVEPLQRRSRRLFFRSDMTLRLSRFVVSRSERKCLPFGSGLLKGSIPEVEAEVTVQQVTIHFLSLPSGALGWVRRKGDLL
jgi:hypothetical protein